MTRMRTLGSVAPQVVDSADLARLEDCRAELHGLLQVRMHRARDVKLYTPPPPP